MRVKIKQNDIAKALRKSEKAMQRALGALALEGESYAKMIIAQSPPTGSSYGDHKASSPGKPPRIDTGALVNSISHEPSGNGFLLVSGMEYGPWLEFGAEHMEKRPFMIPTVKYLAANGEAVVIANFKLD